MNIIIFNNNKKKDAIFDIISPFTKENLNDFFIIKKCLYCPDDVIKNCIDILPSLSEHYVEYYKYIKSINEVFKYKIQYELTQDKKVLLKIYIDKCTFFYDKEFSISVYLFNSLFNMYMNNYYKDVYKKYDIKNDIPDNVLLTHIYILLSRYKRCCNSKNQCSVISSFKTMIKHYFNVKIELFGSALNTSMSKFGSIFPDIEYAFGSLGNYFDINIKRGYFEINPVFDNCLINDIFIKTYNELKKAELHNQPLLFLLIIPSTYFKKNQMLNDIIPFIKFNATIPKDNF